MKIKELDKYKTYKFNVLKFWIKIEVIFLYRFRSYFIFI